MATKGRHHRVPWNKGKVVGQKAPLKLREIWAIRVRLQLRSSLRASLCSTWRSIQSSGPATSCVFGSATLLTGTTSTHVRW